MIVIQHAVQTRNPPGLVDLSSVELFPFLPIVSVPLGLLHGFDSGLVYVGVNQE